MAKPSWLTLDKTSGTGNGTFKASASAHSGRVNRTGSIVVASTKDSSKKATISITQTANAEFVDKFSVDKLTIQSTETQIAVTCVSNSKYFCVQLSSDFAANTAFKVYYGTTPAAAQAATQELTATKVTAGNFSYYTIPSDAGASAQYAIRIIITVPVNETISDINRAFTIGGVSSGIPTAFPATIKYAFGSIQKAKVVTLSVSPTSVTIPMNGTAQTVTVTSNDAWQIS